MIVAVTGGRGMLGHALGERMEDLRRWSETECDVTNPAAIGACLDAAHPDVVIHAAAWTDVDGCEENPDAAHAVNAVGSMNVARACRERDVRLITISTDYVFPGDTDRPLTETDPTGPVSVYGESKLEGERAALDAHPDAVVLRTCGLYGPSGRHFAGAIRAKIRAREPLRVVTDQIVSPTYTADLADAIRRVVMGPAVPGVFHVANRGALSWFEFAILIANELGESDHPIARMTSDALDRPAKRPAFSALDVSKFEATFDHVMPAVEDALARFIEADVEEVA